MYIQSIIYLVVASSIAFASHIRAAPGRHCNKARFLLPVQAVRIENVQSKICGALNVCALNSSFSARAISSTAVMEFFI